MNCKVITLPSATERQKRITENFNQFDLPFEFVNGVTRDECEFVQENDKHYIVCRGFKMLFNEEVHLQRIQRRWINFGEIAAYLAHYFVWKDFLKSEDEHIIICEDDAHLNSKIDVYSLFTPNVHFLNLQAVTAHNVDKKQWHRQPIVSINLPLVKYTNKVSMPTMCEGLAGYALSKQGASTLCEYVETHGYIGPNDWLMSELAIEEILEIYSPYHVDMYFTLDQQTYGYSFTHSGEFKTEIKFKEIEMRVKL
jgi:GR25 family glycosyltransferase involved in LPS biosynthesis